MIIYILIRLTLIGFSQSFPVYSVTQTMTYVFCLDHKLFVLGYWKYSYVMYGERKGTLLESYLECQFLIFFASLYIIIFVNIFCPKNVFRTYCLLAFLFFCFFLSGFSLCLWEISLHWSVFPITIFPFSTLILSYSSIYWSEKNCFKNI